jgi:GAF domain-containing protein
VRPTRPEPRPRSAPPSIATASNTSAEGASLAADVETRLADFTGLLGTAIANAESREALAELADEQAALRRVATLVGCSSVDATIAPHTRPETTIGTPASPSAVHVDLLGA